MQIFIEKEFLFNLHLRQGDLGLEHIQLEFGSEKVRGIFFDKRYDYFPFTLKNRDWGVAREVARGPGVSLSYLCSFIISSCLWEFRLI